jgi:hypothetical protein
MWKYSRLESFARRRLKNCRAVQGHRKQYQLPQTLYSGQVVNFVPKLCRNGRNETEMDRIMEHDNHAVS